VGAVVGFCDRPRITSAHGGRATTGPAAETGRPLKPPTIQTALGELEAAGLARGSEEGNGRARYWSPATPDDGVGGGVGRP
jgi:hypothetical protein